MIQENRRQTPAAPREVEPVGRRRGIGFLAVVVGALVVGGAVAGVLFFSGVISRQPAPVAGTVPIATGPSITIKIVVAPEQPAQLVSPDGDVTVDLDAGSVDSEVDLLFTPVSPEEAPPLPEGFVPSEKFFDLSMKRQDAPAQGPVALIKPITITVSLSGSDIQLAGGVESNIVIQHYDDGAGQWAALPTAVDLDSSIAQAEVASLSVFALSIRASGPGTTPPPPPGPVAALAPAAAPSVSAPAAGDSRIVFAAESQFAPGAGPTGEGGWEQVAPFTADDLRDVHFVNENIGFAAADGAIYRTEDGGTTWQRVEVGAAAVERPAPIGAASFRGRSYLIVDESMSWDGAKRYAESLGGYLVTINDEAEHKFLADLARNRGLDSLYIGLTDADKEGRFVWVNGSPLTYTNWLLGEPNNDGNEHFVIMQVQNAARSRWNDVGSFGSPFVVEFEAAAAELAAAIEFHYEHSLINATEIQTGGIWDPGESLYFSRWDYSWGERPAQLAASFDRPLVLRNIGRLPSESVEESGSYTYTWDPGPNLYVNLTRPLKADAGLRIERKLTPSTLLPGTNEVSLELTVRIVRPPTFEGRPATPTGGDMSISTREGRGSIEAGAVLTTMLGGGRLKVLSASGASAMPMLPPFDVGREYKLTIEAEIDNSESFAVRYVPQVDVRLNFDPTDFGIKMPSGQVASAETISFEAQSVGGETASMIWGRMAIVDTKPFKLRVILHRIFVERPQVTGIPAWLGGAACYRRSRYIL